MTGRAFTKRKTQNIFLYALNFLYSPTLAMCLMVHFIQNVEVKKVVMEIVTFT